MPEQKRDKSVCERKETMCALAGGTIADESRWFGTRNSGERGKTTQNLDEQKEKE
jgi:hypothetical protein